MERTKMARNFAERYRNEGPTLELTSDIVEALVEEFSTRDADLEHDDSLFAGCEVGELERHDDWVPAEYIADFEGSIKEVDAVLWEIDEENWFAQLWLSEVTSDGRLRFSWFMGGE